MINVYVEKNTTSENGNSPFVEIQGSLVLKKNKVDLENFEENDNFILISDLGFFSGKIITQNPINIVNDLFDDTKIDLSINNPL